MVIHFFLVCERSALKGTIDCIIQFVLWLGRRRVGFKQDLFDLFLVIFVLLF